MGRVKKLNRGSKSAPRARRSESRPPIELVQELYNVATDTAIRLGASPEQCKTAAQRSTTSSARVRPSETIIQNDVGISNLLSKWRQQFSEPKGSPKALPIKGKKASLESLAREMLPGVPLKEVMSLLLQNAEVIRTKGNKIALVGNSANIVGLTPSSALAWAITGIRHLASTHVHNFALPLEERSKGRLERIVYVSLGLAEFEKFAKDARPQLQEVSNSIEQQLEKLDSGEPGDDKVLCGLAMQLFRKDKPLG